MNLILKLIVNALVIFLVAFIVPGFHVANIFTALLIALVLGLVNITLKPILVLLTLPINILTLGLFTFVINAVLLMLVAAVVKGFNIDNFWAALLAALVISILHFLTYKIGTRQ
jgi:putative membrane protein